MPLYLVRHGKAGSRSTWSGPDELRPLSKTGRAQAARLGKWLAKQPVPRTLSSPYVRCIETVAPLAERLGLKVEEAGELAEGAPVDGVLALVADLPDDTVLCSHGDVILATIEALAVGGMKISGSPDWRKGAIWIIDGVDGAWTTARAAPPR